jgi:cyclophilin family peptidyl-prolyl cis-trans isomerase/HEAT repeat protein
MVGCAGGSHSATVAPPAGTPGPASAPASVSTPGAATTGSAVLPDSDVTRYAALLAMADARQPDNAVLARAISSKSSPLRIEAVRAVGQMDVEDLAPKLRLLLRDRDSAVAATAAYALGLMRDTASVPALAAALGSGEPGGAVVSQRPVTSGGGQSLQPVAGAHRQSFPSRGSNAPTVVREAAWALGQIGNPGRGALERVMNEGFAAPGVLYAAANLRPVPAGALTAYFWPGNPGLLRAAVYAVTRSRSAAGVRALLNVTQTTDPVTRSYVARGLARSAAGDSLSAYAFRALTTLVADSAAVVRIEALGSLRGYGPPAQELVLQGTRDSVATVRLAAAQALDSTLAGAPPVLWHRAFDADTALAYRAAVATAALNNGVVLPVLDPANAHRWAASGDWRYRAAAAMAAAGLPLDRTLGMALAAADDSDPRVRTAAVSVIVAAIDSTTPDGRGRGVVPDRLSQKWAQDPDAGVRAAWLEAMLRLGPRARDVGMVIGSYRLAANDSTVDARLAVVRYVAEAWQRDSGAFTTKLMIAIAALPAPTDPAVLDEARGVPLFNSWHADARRHPPHPPDWYARVVREIVVPSLSGAGPRVAITTDRGVLTLELYGADAPLTVENFLSLMRCGYFNGAVFHRVVPGFVAQDGDRRGDGNGGPGYTIRDELNRRRYDRGAVGMALSGPETGGSQYFVTITPQPHLDGRFTTFAHVLQGYDALDHLVPGDRITEISLVAQQ